MPQPTTAGEVGVVTGRGFPADAVTLEGLFSYRGETLNPVTNAGTEPGVFSPLCGFTGELVLRGGGCQLDFGWYNVTGSGLPPADAEIYTLVPANAATTQMMCTDADFCPLATMMNTQGKSWVPQTFNADDIRSNPNYTGGQIGFAIKGGTSGSFCSQTKYSQRELNVQCTSCTPVQPWVTTLIYQSTATPDAFYVAFEDLPMEAGTWQVPVLDTTNGQTYLNDGDFNDFVYFITGLACKGGGQPCDTGMPGACASGRTDCEINGMSQCRAVVTPEAETCDNIDNDCNGVVDDGSLCGLNEVCDKGTCVKACGTGEFNCDAGLECDAGFCVDPLCVGVTCLDGQVCRQGQCVGGCGPEVICPKGQACQLGRCVDLCANAQCPENTVCENGVCVSSCQCRPCIDTQACAADGRCVDAGCESMQCGAGQNCVAGTCQDACAGVVCPGNAACEAGGVCGPPMTDTLGPMTGAGGSTSMGGTGTISIGGSLVITIGGTTSAGGSGTTGDPGLGRAGDQGGCNCRLSSPQNSAWGLLAVVLGVGVAWRRRQRRNA